MAYSGTTGQKNQQSGIFDGRCPKKECGHIKQIALSKGDTFPPCGKCTGAITWTLNRATQ